MSWDKQVENQAYINALKATEIIEAPSQGFSVPSQSKTAFDFQRVLIKQNNYRTLNDNTYKDQYSLPGINTILKKVGNSKIYSKFDLKSGFHQVAMDASSIEWTAFICPSGLYEWLAMP